MNKFNPTRLIADDWLMAGFRALARTGPSALRAEALARDLGATKGSFYWHFRDLQDYLDKLISYWEHRAFDGVIDMLDEDQSPRAKLEQLCILATGFRDADYGGAALEPALRAWALSSPEVAAAIARMDARRMDYVADLCRQSGIQDKGAALALYGLAVGLEQLGSDDAETAMRLLLTAL